MGSGIRKLLSSSGSPGLAPGHQSPTPRGRSALKHKQIDTECLVAAPWFLRNKFGIPRPEPVGEAAQPIFTSIISTAPYLVGSFCTDRATAQPGKSPLPPAPRRSLQQSGEMPPGRTRCNTYLCLRGWPYGVLCCPHTHHPPLFIQRSYGKGAVCLYGGLGGN